MCDFLRILSFRRTNPLRKGVVGNDPRVVPSHSSTNLNHFYPVAERAQAPKSRSTGFGSEQPEIVARNTATSESVQTKSKGVKSPCLKFLRSRGFFQEAPCGFGQSPRSSPPPYDNSSRKNARIFFSSRETLTCVKPRRSATRCCVMLRK